MLQSDVVPPIPIPEVFYKFLEIIMTELKYVIRNYNLVLRH